MRILVAAYTVLAIASGSRSAVQLATRARDAPVSYALSALAAVVYITLALALRRGGSWLRLAAIAATAELVGVIAVGTAEQLSANAWPDESVWSGYGAGYGWVPLVLPAVTLAVLHRRRPAEAALPLSTETAPTQSGSQPSR